MNTELQQKAHECAERAAHYKREFTRIKHIEITVAAILISLGLLTLPVGVLFIILGCMAIGTAILSHHTAEEAHKKFFELRDECLKEIDK